MIHVEFYQSKKEAMTREADLKTGMGRTWIKENVLGNL